MHKKLLQKTIKELYKEYPWIDDFFASHLIDVSRYDDISFTEMVDALDETFFAEQGCDRRSFLHDFQLFMTHMQALQNDNKKNIRTITISAGYDKSGTREACSVTLSFGEVTAIVGPTGAGKSRLLEDIECLAQKDTPTRRKILVNNHVPSDEVRFATEDRLIAQLSQNMNFVMDLSVEDFLTMHAESRMVENIAHAVSKIYETANILAGEPFTRETAVTQLSGGQSRALMIADTALLSAAPIILIDEIENAGVDKVKALELLVTHQKIVLLSTHDPLLALSADQRIIIKNGGMQKIITTTEKERKYLIHLKKLDSSIGALRQKLRAGEIVETGGIIV